MREELGSREAGAVRGAEAAVGRGARNATHGWRLTLFWESELK